VPVRRLRVDHGVELAVHDDYFGPPWAEPQGTLVLVHGVGESAVAFQQWVPELAGRWQVLRIDLPGFGESTIAGRDFSFLTFDRVASYAARAVSTYARGPAVVVGTKTGGIVTVLLADRYPALVAGAAVIGSFLIADDTLSGGTDFTSLAPEMAEEGFGRWAQRTMPARLGADGTPELLAWWSRFMGDSNEDLCTTLAGAAAGIDLRESLARLACPFLLVSTERSPMVSPETLAKWAGLNPLIETAILPGDGYQLAYSRVPETAAVVRDFVDRHRLLPGGPG
jgi:3-oxoadipate enol-lactonase